MPSSLRGRGRSTRSCASTCRRASTSTSSKRWASGGDKRLMSDRQMKGILGTKLGMTQVFDEQNRGVPVAVVNAGPTGVTQVRTREKDGYRAVQLALGAVGPRKVNKPRTG